MIKFLFSLMLTLAVALVYSQLWSADFVWNDPRDELAATSVEPLRQTAREAWQVHRGESFAPLAPTVWTLVKASPVGAAGTPRPFHLLSLAIHLGSAVLVLLIATTLSQSVAAGLVGALIFALHPLQVEAVSYLSAFEVVLGGFLALWAVLAYLRYVTCRSDARDGHHRKARPLRRYWLGTLAFTLALLAWPATAITPALAWLLAKLLPRSSSLLRARRPAWPLALWTVLAAVAALWEINAQNTLALSSQLPFWAKPLIAGDALAFYLQKIVAPLGLGPDYGRSPSFVLGQWWGYLTWLAPVALLLVLGYWRGKAQPKFAAAVGVLVFALLPYLGFYYFEAQATSTVADRQAYLAMLAPALAAAFAVTLPKKSWLQVAMAVAILACGWTSRQGVRHWLSNDSLFTWAVEVNPASPVAHAILGDSYRREGNLAKAREHYEKVLKVNVVNPSIYFHLGEIERRDGHAEKAAALYEKALALDPTFPDVYGRLGLAYLEKGEHDQALAHFQKAVELSPDDGEPLRYLGLLHVRRQDYAAAIPHLLKALRLAHQESVAEQAEIHGLLGLALAHTAQPDLALEHLETALRLDPGYVAAHRTLGDLYFARAEHDKARPHYQKAVSSSPGDPVVFHNLGVVLAGAKEFTAAAQYFAKSLELRPNDPETLNQLGIAYFRVRNFKDARTAFEQVLALDPTRADPHYYLGDIARWQGRKAEAFASYYKALKIDPHHLEANYRLGNHFMQVQDAANAIRHYQAALKSAPEDPKLLYGLRKAERAEKDGARGETGAGQAM